MAKTYWFRFGEGNPANTAGLSPTLIHFVKHDGTTLSPPGVTEPISGTGLYKFDYTPSFSIAFIADGATSGLASSLRYVAGSIDPADRVDELLSQETGTTLTAMGTTLSAIGLTLSTVFGQLGTTASSFGSTSTDPGDVFGYLKRIQEVLEGNQDFLKSTGALQLYSRGSSTLLRVKTLTASTTGVTRL